MTATYRIIDSTRGLDEIKDRLQDLAEGCSIENVFYEPHLLLPAVRHLSTNDQIFFFCLEGSDGELLGFAPVSIEKKYRGLPISYLSFWKHIHCYFCHPLVKDGFEESFWKELFRWINENKDLPQLFLGSYLAGTSKLIQALSCTSPTPHQMNSFKRAWYQKTSDTQDEFLHSIHSGKHLKDFRRRKNRLEEMGRVRIEFSPPQDFDSWFEQFIALEASGWKGKNGTALGNKSNEREFARDVFKNSLDRGRLLCPRIYIDDRLISAETTLRTRSGGFSFKIAYDESLSKLSPGSLLVLEYINYLFGHPEMEWLDSCATPNHPLADRFWKEKREIAEIIVPLRAFPEGLIFNRILPALRSLKKRFK